MEAKALLRAAHHDPRRGERFLNVDTGRNLSDPTLSPLFDAYRARLQNVRKEERLAQRQAWRQLIVDADSLPAPEQLKRQRS